MRVLHITPAFEPAWAFGPMPRRIAALARAQAADGDAVTVLTTDAVAPHERIPHGESSQDGVRVVRVRNISALVGYWIGLSTPAGFRARLTALVHEADVVHCHGLRTVETWLASRATPTGIPLVLSAHEGVGARGGASTLWDAIAGHGVARRIDAVAALDDTADAASIREVYAGAGARTGSM